MRSLLPIFALTITTTMLVSESSAQFKTPKEKASYAIGLNFGRRLKMDDLDVDPAAVGRGIVDGLTDKAQLTDKELEAVLEAVGKEMEARARAKVEADKVAAAKYMTDNKKTTGVVALPSGLQYQVLKSGDGAMPKATDTVKVHYTGKLTDGTVFDSSVERKMPATFAVNRVIRGWVEALQKMRVGDKWRLFIPPELGYGERGTPGGPIPPHAVLIFETELLGIEVAEGLPN